MTTFPPSEARRFYDRFGARQDRQLFYEAPALAVLLAHGDFAHARSVFEFGCGTGRLARELLDEHLPAAATYQGIDLSATMVALASERLAPFAARATVSRTSGDTVLSCASGSVDRLLSTYVLDLLDEARIGSLLDEAHRVLVPAGLLCLAGITPGATRRSRVVMHGWNALFRLRPALVGGCRPLRVAGLVDPVRWQIEHREVVVAWGIASEVLVARRRPDAAA